MEERRTDTEETFGDQPLPADTSDQNAEEPSAPEGDSGDSHRHQPRREDAGNPGGAGEGSQATGHPENAG